MAGVAENDHLVYIFCLKIFYEFRFLAIRLEIGEIMFDTYRRRPLLYERNVFGIPQIIMGESCNVIIHCRGEEKRLMLIDHAGHDKLNVFDEPFL